MQDDPEHPAIAPRPGPGGAVRSTLGSTTRSFTSSATVARDGPFSHRMRRLQSEREKLIRLRNKLKQETAALTELLKSRCDCEPS